MIYSMYPVNGVGTLTANPAIVYAVCATGTAIVVTDKDGNVKWTQPANSTAEGLEFECNGLVVASGTGNIGAVYS